MTDYQKDWVQKKNELVSAIRQLGYPEELGESIAKQLGSPRAMERMLGYLYHEMPRNVEILVDEALAIRSDFDRWRDKKAAEEYNAKYNEMLYYGLGTEDDE
jgi:hypothetical protein